MWPKSGRAPAEGLRLGAEPCLVTVGLRQGALAVGLRVRGAADVGFEALRGEFGAAATPAVAAPPGPVP